MKISNAQGMIHIAAEDLIKLCDKAIEVNRKTRDRALDECINYSRKKIYIFFGRMETDEEVAKRLSGEFLGTYNFIKSDFWVTKRNLDKLKTMAETAIACGDGKVYVTDSVISTLENLIRESSPKYQGEW